MKFVVAIDSFKDSITSLQAENAVKDSIIKVFPDSEVITVPIADGGEGTVNALCDKKIKLEVHGPLNDLVIAEYGIIEEDTAVIEMASASGLYLVNKEMRNPMYTTTYGVGELIVDAINRGCRKFIVGIGGSATNDGGVGMLTALGFKFLDKFDKEISLGAIGLKDLYRIDVSGALPQLSECCFEVACDVSNPLCGENGCSYVFAPQKGANLQEIELMDSWLKNYAKITKNIYKNADKNFKGAGAAGGMGFAFLSFLNSTLKSGIEIITKLIKLEEKIINSDFVITGEGKLDGQSVMGKTPIGVANIAKKYNIPVIAFCGCLGVDAIKCNEFGIDAYFPILNEITTLEQALDPDYTYLNLKKTSEQIFKLIKSIKNT